MERSKNASFAPIYTEKKLKLEASIELAAKKMEEEEMPMPSPPPILFYSPNRVPEELAPEASLKTTTTTMDSGAEDVTRRPLTLGMPVHSLKMSTSLADLWPSRFPTDEEDELQLGGMNATGDGEAMVRSSVFTSSILEEGTNNNNKGTIEALSSKPEMKPNQAQDPSRSSRFQRHNRRLSRIFRNFRHQLDRTKETFRASLNNTDEWKKQQRVPMPTSRSFPIASSSSMISLENYWWRSIRHREAAVPTSPKDRFFITTEAFTGAKPEHLSVQPGQKLEMLHANQLDQSAEFVKVAAVMETGAGNGASGAGNSSLKGHHQQQRGPVGLVPRRILLPLAPSSPAGTSDPAAEASTSTSQAYEDSSAAAGSSKRTSIRRFFTSNQKAESSGKNNHRHQHHPNSSPAERPTSSSSASSALRTAESAEHQHQLQPATSVLSPSSQPTVPTTTQPSSSAQQNNSSSCTGPSTSASSALNNDIDLPPPMDQLGASGTSATGAAAGDEAVEGMAGGTAMPVEEQQQNNTCNSGGTPAVGGVEPSSSTTATTTAGTTAGTPVEQMSPEESAKLKRSYVIQELVETERAYVVDLATIVDGYIGTLREMELPDEDREKVKIIFANIEQILDFHKSFFCKEIEKSLLDYEACGNAFIKYERRLHTFYVKYCQNKPKSDFLISQDNFEQLFSDIREKLGHKVALTDLLIKPVQRITKYQLMLNDILKYTHRAKDRADVLERAHDVMRVVPKACDDMMQVGRLQGFQGNLNAQGRLIHQGTLSISDGGTNQPFKGKDRRVFLFEQSVIIAECIPPRKEYGNPLYNFKNQIMVNKMQLLEEQVPDEPLRFVLQSNDPNQVATYVAQATSAEEKAQWLAKLSAQLDQQKTFLAALVDPKRYQSQLANSMGSVNISGKKDSSGSLGTPTSPAPPTGLGISPAKQQQTTAHGQQHKSSSSSKLFGFGKQKS